MEPQPISGSAATSDNHWYAIRTLNARQAERLLTEDCAEVFFPKEETRTKNGIKRMRALLPRVLFINTTRENALSLEERSHRPDSLMRPFWIYRYVKGGEIQQITDSQIHLFRLITSPDAGHCEVFTKADFKPGVRVRVTGGIYAGYEGTVQRVKKNRHVLVEIEGICMVLLPFIHPDLLEKVD